MKEMDLSQDKKSDEKNAFGISTEKTKEFLRETADKLVCVYSIERNSVDQYKGFQRKRLIIEYYEEI